MARASAFQAEGRGFESRFPLHYYNPGGIALTAFLSVMQGIICSQAHVAQSVEHILGKDEVTSSILVVGSIFVKVGAT